MLRKQQQQPMLEQESKAALKDQGSTLTRRTRVLHL